MSLSREELQHRISHKQNRPNNTDNYTTANTTARSLHLGPGSGQAPVCSAPGFTPLARAGQPVLIQRPALRREGHLSLALSLSLTLSLFLPPSFSLSLSIALSLLFRSFALASVSLPLSTSTELQRQQPPARHDGMTAQDEARHIRVARVRRTAVRARRGAARRGQKGGACPPKRESLETSGVRGAGPPSPSPRRWPRRWPY